MTHEGDHLSIEIIQRLCEGALPDIEQCFVEDHLAECDDCRGVFRRMDVLFYRGFSAEAHAAAIRRKAYETDPLIVALRRGASQLGRDVNAIFQRWLDTTSAFWGYGDVPLFGTFSAVPVSGSTESEPVRVTIEPGIAKCRVRVAQSRRVIQVEVPGGPKPQAALLFDPDSETAPIVAAFETTNSVHIAHFDGVPRGEYFLAVSPF